MNTKRTILSEKELNLIEDIIAKYSVIVTFEQIYSILKKKMSRQSVRNLTNKLARNGWLVRIKKGIYSIASLEARGFLATPSFKIAQILVKDSYISFEAALQYHGMFDQMLKTIASISLKRYQIKEVHGTNYKFIRAKKGLFFGWEEKRVENYFVKVATPEKAILDMLSFKRNVYTVDLVLEKLREYKHQLEFARLNKFSRKHSKAVQRILGFLLDKVSLDSDYIYNLTKKDRGCSYMTKDSKKFDAKWRLYFHSNFGTLE
ncbi:MAG: hypothetical protein A2W05_07510 [Candidatus Schekmanbacteria bacterium RBG_16_38_10]|uniref:Uncharacterized protein n=1 Tax=Candidatus Schekmanbacteria bacterium RBG_16_38_10 TaxID=1817879 RepID=A0A1F7S1D8_9BACT|nr:MAG: hypothetical protein A2W05_07510 [Candidatus Schekmanbacteria bacterium RBG_16_38_10]